MSIPDALITCYKKSLTIKGRASRSEYWWFQLHVPVAFFFAVMIDPDGYFLPILLFLLFFISIPANFCVIVRRWHDLNRSGWHILILLIPWIGALVTFIYFCFGSVETNNCYGSKNLQGPFNARNYQVAEQKTMLFEDKISKLKSIANLRDSGILSEHEFKAEKAKIMPEHSVGLQNSPPRNLRPTVAPVQQTSHQKHINLQENFNVENHQVEEPKDTKKKGLINELNKMLAEGLISNEEYEKMKQEIIG